MALAEDLEEGARENSANNNRYIQEKSQNIDSKPINDSSVLKSRRKEKRDRWNSECVNGQIAKMAEVSPAKVFRYKEIVEHGTPEEIEAVDSGKAKICPTYDKIKAREKVE